MARHIESRLQRACVKYFRYQYPGMARLCFAVPNGGFRSGHEASIMQGEGVTPGVSDLVFLKSNAQYSSLCIEFKTDDGRQSEYQKDWQELVEKHGNKYVICRSLEQFIDEITMYLKSK